MDNSIPINTIPILHSDYQLTVASLFAMAGNKDKFNFYMHIAFLILLVFYFKGQIN